MITRHGLSVILFLIGLGLVCADCSRGNEAPLQDTAPTVASAADKPSLPAPDVPAPEQSAGVVIGVAEFKHGPSLPYTINDAVDFAHSLAVEHKLLPMKHMQILLTGDPSGASQKRYDEMRGDALIGSPTKANVAAALKEQAAMVGPEGVLYIYVASHGFSHEQDNFVLTADSDPAIAGTTLSAEDILDATQSAKGRIVLILDSCRVRDAPFVSEPEQRDTSVAPASRAPTPFWRIARELTRRPGYAAFFATRYADPAIEDPARLNGVFTGAILDGLVCTGASAQTRPVSLFSLASFVQEKTKERSKGLQIAELQVAEGFRDFLLFRCGPIGEILEPKDHAAVKASDTVRLRIFQPGTLYTRAVVHSLANGVYYPQHLENKSPRSSEKDVALPVDFGLPGQFEIYVGLGADGDSLPTEDLRELPEMDSRGRPIYWLGPVQVTLPN